ncbi:MAG: TatD family hydrolase [Holosporaceae bacterium]|jgi:TatD DNase family protein|nr:TatD family hydrolase [Holosporaceae bacterium]
MFFVDSHSHLAFSRFKDDFKAAVDDNYSVDAIITRAADAKVKYMLAVATELSEAAELQAISEKFQNIFVTTGIHPQGAKKHCELYGLDEIARVVRDNCKRPKTVGIGEIGLDYHYERESEKQQKELFNLQLELATELDLPVSIHCRDASEDVAAILKDHPSSKGVIHCFSGEKSFAKKALDLGFYISISGVVTYKKATELQDSIKYVPTDRLLIETDCPFLAPVPYRGKLNEPAFVVHTAKKIAELLDVSLESVADFSSRNFSSLFQKAKGFL